jgi:plastocyanin
MQRQLAWGVALVAIGIAGLIALSALTGGDPWDQPDTGGPPGRWGQRGPMMPGFGGPHMGPWGMWGPRDRPGAGSQLPPVAGARTLDVVATDFSFQPAEVSLRAGEAVNIRLVNQGVAVHDLLVPALGVWLIAAPGQSATSGLKFDWAGSYEFFCSVPGHREAGMVGRIVVTP